MKRSTAANHLELDRVRVELGLLESGGDDAHIDNVALPVVCIRAVDKIQYAFRPSGNIDDLDVLCNNGQCQSEKAGLSILQYFVLSLEADDLHIPVHIFTAVASRMERRAY